MPISDDTDCIFKGHLMLGCPFFVRIETPQAIVKRLQRCAFGFCFREGETVDIDTPIC